jgi:hypothetical protein
MKFKLLKWMEEKFSFLCQELLTISRRDGSVAADLAQPLPCLAQHLPTKIPLALATYGIS